MLEEEIQRYLRQEVNNEMSSGSAKWKGKSVAYYFKLGCCTDFIFQISRTVTAEGKHLVIDKDLISGKKMLLESSETVH